MAESPAHRGRVAGLVLWMRQQGVRVTHASGGLSLPEPYKIGRHEPDAIGLKDGVAWIGEAKTGDDLATVTAQEQLADFSTCQMPDTGVACPFVLCVPERYREAAGQAVLEAGGSTASLTVIA